MNIIKNKNNTYTVISKDGWSVTANATQLELTFNQCFGISLLEHFKRLG